MVGGRSRYNVRVRNVANRGTSRSHMRKPQRTSHVHVRRPSRSRVGLWKASMPGMAGFPEDEPCAVCRGSKMSEDGGECGACDGTGLEHIARRASLDDRIAQAREDTHDKATQRRIHQMDKDRLHDWRDLPPHLHQYVPLSEQFADHPATKAITAYTEDGEPIEPDRVVEDVGHDCEHCQGGKMLWMSDGATGCTDADCNANTSEFMQHSQTDSEGRLRHPPVSRRESIAGAEPQWTHQRERGGSRSGGIAGMFPMAPSEPEDHHIEISALPPQPVEMLYDAKGNPIMPPHEDIKAGEPMALAWRLLKEALDTPKSGFTDTDHYPNRALRGPGRDSPLWQHFHNMTGNAQQAARMRQFYESLPYGTLTNWESPGGVKRKVWPQQQSTKGNMERRTGHTMPVPVKQMRAEIQADFDEKMRALKVENPRELTLEEMSAEINRRLGPHFSRTRVGRKAEDDEVFQSIRETPDVMNDTLMHRVPRPHWRKRGGKEGSSLGRGEGRVPTEEEEEQWGMCNTHTPIHGILTPDEVDVTGDPDWWKRGGQSVLSGDAS